MLPGRSSKIIKGLLSGSGLKFLNLTKDDVLSFSRTRRGQSVESFLHSLNKYGFQYKTVSDNNVSVSIQIFVKGKKPRSGKQQKGEKNKKGIKNEAQDKASYIRRASVYFADDEVIRSTLKLPFISWDLLRKNYDLIWIIRSLVQKWIKLTNSVKSYKWLFEQVDEDEFATLVNDYLKNLEKFRSSFSSLLEEESSYDTLGNKLKIIDDKFTTLLQDLDLEDYKLVSNVKNALLRNQKNAEIISDIKSLFPLLSQVWVKVRELLVSTFPATIKSDNELVKKLIAFVGKKGSVNKKLSEVRKGLRDNCSFLLEDKLKGVHVAINSLVKLSGKIPSFRNKDFIKVSIDDCPDTNYPSRFTKTSKSFAYCQYEKKCPHFGNNVGSYVNCKLLGQQKTGGTFVKDVKKIDEDTYKVIESIGIQDPQVKAIILLAEQDKKLYYGEILDNRLLILLDNYPSSVTRNEYDYTVYIFENEPILVIGSYVISANLELLKQLADNTQIFQW